MAKVVVLGLCGATLSVINQLIEEGKLPTFRKLIEEGVSGILKPEFPPITPVNWASFMTGKNPGKHGIFDYEEVLDSGLKRIVDSRCLRSKTLWRILSDFGKKVGVVHVPLTYPPEKVNGFIVPGYVLSQGKTVTYPPGLEEELIRNIPGFAERWSKIKWYRPGKEREFLESMKAVTKVEERVTLYLMRKFKCDFFISTFFFLDEVQHYLWKFYDVNHPHYNRSSETLIQRAIPSFYEMLDETLGKILKEVNRDTTVIVFSDHEFGPLYGTVFPNHYLYSLGLLKLKRTLPTLIRNLLLRLNSKLKLHLKYPKMLRLSLSDVDFKRTVAYSTGYVGKIFINKDVVKTEEELNTIREYIIHKLYELREPSSGVRIVDKVFVREELYYGPHVSKAPHILFTTKNMYYITRGGGAVGGGGVEFGSNLEIVVEPPVDDQSGWHRDRGFFIIKGPEIKKNAELKEANIKDLMPTILHIMNVPIPPDVDGHILEVFK